MGGSRLIRILILLAIIALGKTDQDGPFVRAELTTGILIATAIGALFLAKTLQAKAATGKRQKFDDSFPSFASRNAPIPYVIGRRRVGSTVISVWGRVAKTGIGNDESGGPGETRYRENAVHCVCLGPVTALREIRSNGKPIWTGNATPDAEGKYVIDLGTSGKGLGRCTFYFGSQEAQAFHRRAVSGEIEYLTTNRYLAFAVWERRNLGPTPVWETHEYDVEAFCPGSALAGSERIVVPAGGDDDLDRGVNAAHAIWQLLTAPYPHGRGLPASMIGDSLEALGVLFETEGFGVNLLIDGESLDEVLKDLANVGGFMFDDVNGVLDFVPLREISGSVPILNAENLATPDSEIRISLGENAPTRVDLTIADIRQNFRANSPISIHDDGISANYQSFRRVSVKTDAITSQYVGAAVGHRMIAQAFGDRQTQKIRAMGAAHLLRPGRPVDVAGLGVVRVNAALPEIETQITEVEVVYDSYGVPPGSDVPAIPPSSSRYPAEPDTAIQWFRVSGDSVRIIVLRARAHNQISGATIFVSVNAGDFLEIGSQNYASVAGTIDSSLASSGAIEVESGPIFAPMNEDAIDLLPLDDASWRSGKRITVLGTEVLFGPRELDPQPESNVLRSTAYSLGDFVIPPSGTVTGLRYECVQAGTTASDPPAHWPGNTRDAEITDGSVKWQARPFAYQMLGLIRATSGTVAETHAIGATAMIADRDSLVEIGSSLLTVGATICVATSPFTSSRVSSVDDSIEVCRILAGAIEPGETGEALLSLPSGATYTVTPSGSTLLVSI